MDSRSLQFAETEPLADDRARRSLKRADLSYQVATVAIMLVLLAGLWIF